MTLVQKSRQANVLDNVVFANGDYTTASFVLDSDGSGGTLLTDPPTSPMPISQGISASVGGAGNDSFVFKFNTRPGADTVTNFKTVSAMPELDGHKTFEHADLIAAIVSNGIDGIHGDAFINSGHGDGTAVTHVTESYLHLHLNHI
jgi:hypothetical protein